MSVVSLKRGSSSGCRESIIYFSAMLALLLITWGKGHQCNAAGSSDDGDQTT